jgi:ribosome maturation factor RimP
VQDFSENGKRGTPSFLFTQAINFKMITPEQVRKIAEEYIAGTEKFIVDVAVNSGNRIIVEIDSPRGININDCTAAHRFIESKLDRNVEDFELTVSSPGLEEPFKILKQYRKNTGRMVRVVHKTGIVTEGELAKADDEGIEIYVKKKEKLNGKKQLIVKSVPISFVLIKETRLII